MMYILALLVPPLALLLSGKPFQAIFSAAFWILAWILTLFAGAGFVMWVILAVHAIFVVRDRNTRKMMEDIARQSRD